MQPKIHTIKNADMISFYMYVTISMYVQFIALRG